MKDLLRLVSGADKRIYPTLSQLSENDIYSIWSEVSTYIVCQMTLQKGVHLAGLGTFTFSQQKLDIGRKFTMIQRPIFLLTGRLLRSLGLKQVRPLAAAKHLPVLQLNFTAVSQETPFSRDVVEGCVRETLLLLFRALASEQNLFLALPGIGIVSFRNSKVQMKFSTDFIKAVDRTGNLLLAFNSRPGCSVSLLSAGVSRLQQPQTTTPNILPTVCSPRPDNKAADKDLRSSSPAPDQRNVEEVPQQRGSASRQTLQHAKMKAVSRPDKPDPKPPMEATDKTSTSISPAEVAPTPGEQHGNLTCSDHTRAGQELCYVCMQRNLRNVPVDLRKQQQDEEKAQEKIFLLNEQEKDKQHMEGEQMKLKKQRELAEQYALFNRQMSEKRDKTQYPLFPVSLIFPAQPLTLVKGIQQSRYMSELQSQIERRRELEGLEKQSRYLLERLEQVQLAKEIASQRAQQFHQKQEKAKLYKEALDTQVEHKRSMKTPECQPNISSPQHHRCDTADISAEGRKRAEKLLQANVSTSIQKKEEELHKRQEEREKDREILKRSKMESISDYMNRTEQRRNISKSLVDDWSRSTKLKQEREDEEKLFQRSAGLLLVDQFALFNRCSQCKRKVTNCGQTNVGSNSLSMI